MSFDLTVFNGDLKVSNTGDLATVEGTSKLVQDVLKVISTRLGANSFFPWYGCPITQALIGRSFTEAFTATQITSMTRASIERVQALQKEQLRKNQIVSPSEQIAALQDVQVRRHPSDPRFYHITIVVLTKAFDRVEIPTDIHL